MIEPLVSIIVPCHNAAPWISYALVSVFQQTWSNIEVIVVDDGSTDETPHIVNSHAYPRLAYVRRKKSGASAARNHGLSLSKGEYIQFLDADDMLDEDKIRQQVLVAEENPGKLISCSWRPFRDKLGDLPYRPAKIFRDLSQREFFDHVLSDQGDLPHVCFLVPRSIMVSAGPWDESLSVNDDGEYTARLVHNSRGIVHVGDKPLFHYRKQAHSLSTIDCSVKVRSAMLAIDKMAKTARVCGVDVAETKLPDYYYRLMTSSYPLSKPYIAEFRERIEKYGGNNYKPRLGGRGINTLARLIGWKAARRVQIGYQRLKKA